MDTLLSAEDCDKILQNYLKASVTYVSHKIVPISEDVEGFMGEHYRLQISYLQNEEEKIAKLFIKTKPMKNKIQADMANQSPVYIKEIFFYDTLCKEFEQYGYDTSFASKIYYNIPNQTLVMDDLNELNYKILPRHVKFSEEKIKGLLHSLALYHGAGFAYEKTKSKELGRKYNMGKEYPIELCELFFYLYTNPEIPDKFWKGNFSLTKKLIDILPKSNDYKQKFKQMIEDVKFCKTFAEDQNVPKTCGHGDLWSNNMMFKQNKCILVDFQIIRYNSPVIDVILAIFSNTSAEMRQKNLQDLYNFYYESLADILDKYGYNISEILSPEDYQKSIAIFKHEVLMQVLSVNAITCLPKKDLTGFVNKNDESLNQIFENKDDLAVDAFQNDSMFRQVMSESLYDLYDALDEKFK